MQHIWTFVLLCEIPEEKQAWLRQKSEEDPEPDQAEAIEQLEVDVTAWGREGAIMCWRCNEEWPGLVLCSGPEREVPSWVATSN